MTVLGMSPDDATLQRLTSTVVTPVKEAMQKLGCVRGVDVKDASKAHTTYQKYKGDVERAPGVAEAAGAASSGSGGGSGSSGSSNGSGCNGLCNGSASGSRDSGSSHARTCNGGGGTCTCSSGGSGVALLGVEKDWSLLQRAVAEVFEKQLEATAVFDKVLVSGCE